MRYKKFCLSPLKLMQLIRHKNLWEVTDGIPIDSVLVSAGCDMDSDQFYIVVEHSSFEGIMVGREIPTGECTIRFIPPPKLSPPSDEF